MRFLIQIKKTRQQTKIIPQFNNLFDSINSNFKEWKEVSNAEKKRIGYDAAEDDGAFWMSFNDWAREFEMFTICMLPLVDPQGGEVSER